MRRLICAGTALGLSIALFGCFGSNSTTPQNGNQPGQSGQGDHGPTWTLKLQSVCFSAADDQCVGKYGFSVSADGKYQVGPANGQELRGVLTDAQMTGLNAKLQPVLALPHLDANTSEGHESGVENEGDDTLILTRQNQSVVIAHNTGAELYFRAPRPTEAISLHKAIRDLADLYYRLPFGNECAAAAAAVESLYPAAQGCQVDSDCIYVNAYAGYEAVPPRSVQYLFTDRCEVVKPMVVANRISIVGAAQGLMAAYQAALHSCDRQIVRQNCSYQQAPTSTAPVCAQNRCQSRL